jgi:predicted membrane metal-binding protein
MKQAYNFLPCLAAIKLGILFENCAPLGLSFALASFAVACGATLCALAPIHTNLRIATAITLSMAAGSIAFALQTTIFKQQQAQLAGHYHYLAGIVTSKQTLQHPRYKEYLTVALEGGKHEKFFSGQRLNAAIGVYSQASTNAALGDKVLLTKVAIKPPIKASTPDDLSLAKQGIAATIFISGKWQCKVLEHENNSLRALFWQWRQALYDRVIKNFSPTSGAYVGLLFFGNKQHAATIELQDTFSQWGLSHYLARSGLHIVLLISMWFILLRLIPINIRLKNLFLCAFLLMYVIYSWESTSFLRALFVFLLTQGGIWINREIKTLHLLTIICMGMILYNPFLIFYLDFQLTFGLTFGLLTFSKHLSA